MRLSKKGGHGALSFEPVEPFPQLHVLLTNTRVPRKTSALVARVRALHEANPRVTTPIFEAMAAIAESFLDLCTAHEAPEGIAKQLDLLVQMNHKLLAALQVSAPSLEEVVAIAQADEFNLPTKLTGAGGGGCAFSVLGTQNLDADTMRRAHKCRQRLEAKGYRCYMTAVGGHGVLWHEGSGCEGGARNSDVAAFFEPSNGRSRNLQYLEKRRWAAACAAALVAVGVFIAARGR